MGSGNDYLKLSQRFTEVSQRDTEKEPSVLCVFSVLLFVTK
jgi:hypothetical protein